MKKLFFLICFVVFLSLVSAQPPPREVTSNEGGFQITFNERLVLKKNESIQFNFHIVNITSGHPITTNAVCTFHLYNITGNHIYIAEDSTIDDVFDYEFPVDGGNFTQLGDMNYIITCNDSVFGGSTNVPLLITETGTMLETPDAILYVLILTILVLTFALSLWGAIYIPWRHERDDEGKIIGINDLKYFKIILWMVSYMLALFIFGLMRSIALNWLFLGNINLFFRWIYILLWAFLFPTIIFAVIVAIINYIKDIKIRDDIFRNLDEDLNG
jgi:hypothetical protein